MANISFNGIKVTADDVDGIARHIGSLADIVVVAKTYVDKFDDAVVKDTIVNIENVLVEKTVEKVATKRKPPVKVEEAEEAATSDDVAKPIEKDAPKTPPRGVLGFASKKKA